MRLFDILLLCTHLGQQPAARHPTAAKLPDRARGPAPVYICQGSASYAYHRLASCEGLAWCSTSAKALTKSAAVKLGRRPCGRCAY